MEMRWRTSRHCTAGQLDFVRGTKCQGIRAQYARPRAVRIHLSSFTVPKRSSEALVELRQLLVSTPLVAIGSPSCTVTARSRPHLHQSSQFLLRCMCQWQYYCIAYVDNASLNQSSFSWTCRRLLIVSVIPITVAACSSSLYTESVNNIAN